MDKPLTDFTQQDIQDMTICLASRKVIVSALIYYSFDSSIITDSSYDRLVDKVCEGWDQLPIIRQWQLGSPEELHTSGYHIKSTQYSTLAAEFAYGNFMKGPDYPKPLMYRNDDWRVAEVDGRSVLWLGVSEFSLNHKLYR